MSHRHPAAVTRQARVSCARLWLTADGMTFLHNSRCEAEIARRRAYKLEPQQASVTGGGTKAASLSPRNPSSRLVSNSAPTGPPLVPAKHAPKPTVPVCRASPTPAELSRCVSWVRRSTRDLVSFNRTMHHAVRLTADSSGPTYCCTRYCSCVKTAWGVVR
ncbi:hypothetical protein LX36DRAFT_86031 [Colletotrichum falcatum]|nr:hypothetical protein LX36DRAFT_86031 [Colletotrichum falcatum]